MRAFLERAATLPHLPDTRAIVAELERGAAAATGGSGATIGLWDAGANSLRFFDQDDRPTRLPLDPPQATSGGFQRTPSGWQLDASSQAISARVLRDQHALFFSDDVVREDRDNAPVYTAYGAPGRLWPRLSPPETHRLGALVVYAPRAPIFADSDVDLVQLLADQAAVILESRKLLDAAALAQARVEAARLKEDFLSSAAHDLKTPITGILTQAQVLQRRLDRQPVDARIPTE